MIDRRDFLNTTLAAAACSVGRLPIDLLHICQTPVPDPVFLGRPLDFWVNQFRQGGEVDYWPQQALVAFGATALSRIVGAANPSRYYMRRDRHEVIREITRRDSAAVDYLLDLAKTNFALVDFALQEAIHRDDVAALYLQMATGKAPLGQRAAALTVLSRRFANESDLLHDCPGLTATVAGLVEEYAASAPGGLDSMDAWEVCRSCQFIPYLPCSIDEKLRLCDLLLQLPATDSECQVPDPRGTAIEQLGLIGAPALGRLLTVAVQGTPDERYVAAWSLAGMGEPALAETIRLATSTEDTEREAAYRVFSAIKAPTNVVLNCCRQGLNDTMLTLRITAAVCLVHNGQQALPALEVLCSALVHSEDAYRLRAIRGLADLREPLPEVDKYLPELLDDTNPHVCDAAARRVLRAELGDMPEIFPVLVRAWRDGFGGASRFYMCDALVGCNGEKVLAIALEALADENPAIQDQAIGLLANLGPGAKAAIPALRRHWEQGDPAHQQNILSAVSCIGADDSVLPLVEAGLAASSDSMLFSAAARVAGELGEKHGATLVPKLIAALGSTDVCVQQSAVEALGHCGSGWVSDVLPMLDSAQVALRVAAIKALGYYAPAQVHRVVLEGLDRGLHDPDLAVQLAALMAIEQLRERARSLEVAVRGRLNAPWASVRYQAGRAVAEMTKGDG